MQKKNILLWENVICEPNFEKEHQEVIDGLRSGDYAALKLKKIGTSHPKVYRIREIKKKHKDRLMLATITLNGARSIYMIPKDLIRHHYNRFHGMESGEVKAILNSSRTQTIINNFFEEKEKKREELEKQSPAREDQSVESKEKQKSYVLDYLEVELIGGRWVEFDESQKEVLRHPGALLCKGVPGSGKSLLALACAAKAAENGYKKVYYVTQSVKLKEEMNKQWDEDKLSRNLPDNTMVQFVTYEDLLERGMLGKTKVGIGDCGDWLDRYIKQYKKVQRVHNKGPSNKFFSSKNKVKEFRIISGFANKKAYLLAGVRESLYANKEEREWLWEAYQAYQADLLQRKSYHPAFTPLPEGEYDWLVIDEGQDFSCLQLQSLCEKGEGRRLSIFLDFEQSIFDSVPQLEAIEKVIEKLTYERIKIYELTFCYRCSPEVQKMGQRLQTLKRKLEGGVVTKGRKKKIEGNQTINTKGNVVWLSPKKAVLEELKSLVAMGCIVLTLEEFKKEAKEALGTKLVFTVEEIKGLEWDDVILYRLFDGANETALLQEANAKLIELEEQGKLEEEGQENQFKDRETKSNTMWSEKYVNCTRAKRNLFIYQNTNRIQKIFEFLKPAITGYELPKEGTEINVEQCEKWAKELFSGGKGNIEAAREIFLIQLKRSEEAFQAFAAIHQFKQSQSPIVVPHIDIAPTLTPLEMLINDFNEENLSKIVADDQFLHWLFAEDIKVVAGDKVTVQKLYECIRQDPKKEDIFFTYINKTDEQNLPHVLKLFRNNINPLIRNGLKNLLNTSFKKDDLFHLACICNRVDIIKYLLANRIINPNSIGINEIPSLCIIIKKEGVTKEIEMVEAILADKRTNPNLTTRRGDSPIFLAVNYGHFDTVKRLLANKKIKSHLAANMTDKIELVLSAIRINHIQILELLLPFFPNINFKLDLPLTSSPLPKGRNQQIKRLLNRGNIEGFTLLHYASFFGSKDIFEFLLRNKADVNIKTGNGMTAYQLAEAMEYADILSLFKPINRTQETFLEGFFINRFTLASCIMMLKNERVFQCLFVIKITINGQKASLFEHIKKDEEKILVFNQAISWKDNSGIPYFFKLCPDDLLVLDENTKRIHYKFLEHLETIPHYFYTGQCNKDLCFNFVKNNRIEMIKYLFSKTNPIFKHKYINTAFFAAVIYNQIQMLESLLPFSPDVNYQGMVYETEFTEFTELKKHFFAQNKELPNFFEEIEGMTLLHTACLCGNKEAIEFLLNNNANINIETHNGFTAYQIANEEIQFFLENKMLELQQKKTTKKSQESVKLSSAANSTLFGSSENEKKKASNEVLPSVNTNEIEKGAQCLGSDFQ